nr:hypothetical protein [Desulfobacterales bacterium]
MQQVLQRRVSSFLKRFKWRITLKLKGDIFQMNDPKNPPFSTITEEEIQPVLELLQGGDPDAIARKAGITKERLFRMRDAFLIQAERQRADEEEVILLRKVGRNEACPCGSGKKYKHCCLERHEMVKAKMDGEEIERRIAKEREQQKLIELINKTFDLLASHQYGKAIRTASRLLNRYPNEDRLHDIIATSHLYAGRCDEAIKICKWRWEVAKEEKDYFIKHGRYRDAEAEKPSLSYYYPPMTWLQKYWIAVKGKEYRSLYPEPQNIEIVKLVKDLQTADDTQRFPERQTKGYELRRNALHETIEQLKSRGADIIPYLLPLACRYSWSGLFVPEILSHFKTELSVRSLIDISMFGFSYASGASLHYLEEMGEDVIPFIKDAFSRDKTFDPIKTGIVSVLGNIRTHSSYELLISLLEHESPHIVNWAGGALGKFGNVEALPYMIAANERIGGEHMIDEAIQKLKKVQDLD